MILRRMGLGTLIIMVVILAGSAWLDVFEARAAEKQSVQGGGVTVTVTPLSQAGEAPTFLVTLDTHSVDLNVYEFEKIVRLRDGKGGELAPTAVDAQGGGHHRRATVRFSWPHPRPKSLELVVKDVAGVSERVFRFE